MNALARAGRAAAAASPRYASSTPAALVQGRIGGGGRFIVLNTQLSDRSAGYAGPCEMARWTLRTGGAAPYAGPCEIARWAI